MAATPAQPRTARRAWLAPRFSLAAALGAMTLCAVALWYWFRVPFEVERAIDKERREVETVRRTWGGTVRHGPRRVFAGERLLFVESYQDGVPHGEWEWFDGHGRAYITAQFRRGKVNSFDAPQDCDQRLARHLVERTIDDPRLMSKLFEPTHLAVHTMPLKETVRLLQDEYFVPFSCHELSKPAGFVEGPPAGEVFHASRISDRNLPLDFGLETRSQDLLEIRWRSPPAGPLRKIRQWDIPITCDVREVPLIVALGRILQPHDLVCDYRFGVLCIAEREEAERWQDRTGIDEIVPPAGSGIGANWESDSSCELTEKSLRNAVQCALANHGLVVAVDWSGLPLEHREGKTLGSRITIDVRHIPLKSVLGIILDQAGCRMRLEGETIVVELQPERTATQVSK